MKAYQHFTVVAFIVMALSACTRLPESDARRLALEYRDQWILRENPEGAERLRIGTVKVIERTKTGWLVTFVTETGNEFPTGMHHYYLHIYIDQEGKLEKVVRGPDLLSSQGSSHYEGGA